MIYPSFIKENDCIGVPAPSAGADCAERINKSLNAKKTLEKLGYKLILSENLLKSEKGRSATAKERAKEVNDMFSNKDINMIFCAAGGEFLVEILPYIDFELIKENPKFIAGFSDPIGLLYPITTKCDIATVYGQNFTSFGSETLHQSQINFLEFLKGNLKEEHNYDLYENEYVEKKTGLENYNLTEKVYWKTLDDEPVTIKGRIIGGCFDIISTLAGTKYDGINDFNEKYKNDGIIWYFDNCELSKEETIRVLWKMNELGYFKYTKGIIFGRFGVDVSRYDYDVKSCLEDSILKELNIPVIYDADISHKAPCLTIVNGAISEINVKNGKAKVLFKYE